MYRYVTILLLVNGHSQGTRNMRPRSHAPHLSPALVPPSESAQSVFGENGGEVRGRGMGTHTARDLRSVCSVVFRRTKAPPPIRVTIDCGSKGRDAHAAWRSGLADNGFTVDSFCGLIHSAIPKAIHDGKVILLDDQDGFGNTHVPISLPPPEGFVPKLELPKFRTSKLKVPIMKVPKLKLNSDGLNAPKVGSAMRFPIFRRDKEDSSAERMEKFKKGVRKMLHVVKVLGQIDQYLSERTRIIVDKLSKTFAE